MHSENTAGLQFNLHTDGAPPTKPLCAGPPCRVLVVDDDELVRAQFAQLLIASGYTVELAASGTEALRVLETTRCDIVLTDWQMPDMDGLTLCRQIRTRDRDQYTYLLMLTIRDTQDDVSAGLAAGADDYVVKGVPVEEVLARLEAGRLNAHRTVYDGHDRATTKYDIEDVDRIQDPYTGDSGKKLQAQSTSYVTPGSRSLYKKDVSRARETFAFIVRVAVTAVEAKLELPGSTLQIEALLRAAIDWSQSDFSLSEATGDRSSELTGVNLDGRRKHGIH